DEPLHGPTLRTGTVLGEPSVNLGVARGPSLGGRATEEMSPMALEATVLSRPPAKVYGAASMQSVASRKRPRTGLIALAIAAAVLSALAAVGGIAVYFAWEQDSAAIDEPFLPATGNPPTTVTAEPVPPATAYGGVPIPPPLTPTPTRTTAAPPARRDGGTVDAGVPKPGIRFPDASFPFPIPSSMPPIPSAIPSGIIPAIPIPSGLPFPVPVWPPPPPQ
ncbi:MAG: hypothetical protein MUF54_23210, partial [Polyangiaceae bacterium]|nr:hypothetical protein [Polyangiaceae bacterium]